MFAQRKLSGIQTNHAMPYSHGLRVNKQEVRLVVAAGVKIDREGKSTPVRQSP